MSAVRTLRARAPDGVALQLELRGAGPPVAILHGFTGSARSMAGLARELAERFTAISIDLVGHGASDAPSDPAAYTMERCVAQVCAALDAVGAERAHWLGYSMGGRVALALCAARPERALSALLVGASAGIEDPAARARRRAEDEHLARRIEQGGLEAFVDAWMARPLFASQRRRLAPEALRDARRERLANRPHALALSLRGMGAGAQPPLFARLAAIDTPLCLAAGADDAKFRAIAGELAERLPRGRAAVIPEAGHAAHLENPGALLALAREFFAGCEAKDERSPAPRVPRPGEGHEPCEPHARVAAQTGERP